MEEILQRIMHFVAAEDIEAGTRDHKPKFQTEPTLPIYLKVTSFDILAEFSYKFFDFNCIVRRRKTALVNRKSIDFDTIYLDRQRLEKFI